jgi:translation initiation factor 4G
LKDVVNCVFEKALAEAPFCPTYAKFCYTVSSRKTLADDEKFKENGQVQTFKRLLLNQCQKEFGKHDSYQVDTKIDDAAREVQKKRLLGTIRFVGDLYINKMATARIIKECLNTLLGDIPNEQDIEVCCQLLETCGKHIDGSDPNLLPRYFSTLKLWSSSGDLGICTRIRFKMKDIIELRQKKWKARIEKVKAVKIGEIHKQDQKDKQRAKMASNQNKNRRTNRSMPRNQISDRYSQKPRKAKRDDYDNNSWSSASARKKQHPDRTRGRTEDSRRNYQKKQDMSQKRSKKNEDLTPNRPSMFDVLNDEEEMLPVRGGRQSRQSQ